MSILPSEVTDFSKLYATITYFILYIEGRGAKPLQGVEGRCPFTCINRGIPVMYNKLWYSISRESLLGVNTVNTESREGPAVGLTISSGDHPR